MSHPPTRSSGRPSPLLIALTLITGVLYPAVVTAIAQVALPNQANGSFITVDGKAVGSSLIGQAFEDPKYLWGRPSSAGRDTTGCRPPAPTSAPRARRSSTA